MTAGRRFLLVAAGTALAGCALPRPRGVPEAYALRLSPASLGRELSLQQRMTVTFAGHSQQMDVALEVDAQVVRLAVLAFGQTVARLDWDGRDLRESRAPGWPPAVTGARVLSDLQLVHWPADAIRRSLPMAYTLEADAQERVLRVGSTALARVRYPATGAAEIDNLAAGYRLRLDAWPEAR
ncbi:MAG: hypothetical protein K0R58_1945 [Ramlibacter sp.]|nr:hypothetical protein [Ramlibacter sp.]